MPFCNRFEIMTRKELTSLALTFADLELDQLEELNSHLQLTLKIRRQSEVSVDFEEPRSGGSVEPTLADQARQTLSDFDLDYDFTLADQALLAAVILADDLSQTTFSSRDINDMIEECGRPRVAHITSALGGLTGRSYLVGSTKELSLSSEGRAKARGLIDMINRTPPKSGTRAA